MLSDAVSFIHIVGSIVASIVNAMGEAWQFYVSALTILFVLAIMKQVGYRNGD